MVRTICLAFVAFLSSLSVHAAEGRFNRSGEVAELISLMRSASRTEATIIAQRIYWSGLADPQLARVVNDRLVRDYPTFSLEERRGPIYIDDQYGRWMVRALASFGLLEYRATLENMTKHPKEGGCPLRKVRNEAAKSSGTIEWHAKKNAVFASTANHGPDDEEHISRLVNLLLDPDPTLQNFGLDKIADGRLQDKRLYSTMSEQLAGFVADPSIADGEAKVVTIVRQIKMLRATGDTGYIPLMEQIAAANTDERIQRHGQAAVERLKAPSAAEAQ